MSTVLQVASNVDQAQIQALVFSILEDFGLKPDRGEIDADLIDIEQNYINSGGTFKLLRNENKKIIACYGLYKNNQFECELRKMYLLKDYRGQGLGKFLLDDALAEAKNIGFTRIVLETAHVLTQAIRLYKSYGFRPFEVEHLSNRCDQAYYLDLV